MRVIMFTTSDFCMLHVSSLLQRPMEVTLDRGIHERHALLQSCSRSS
jgi:hypothetical protein